MEIYTDGACAPNPGLGGWAFVILDKENIPKHYSSGISLETTNNRMELKAILEAVRYGISIGDEFIVYSDSEYAIKTCNLEYKPPKKNKDLINEIMSLLKKAEFLNIRFEWVMGHNGNIGNEIADFYANLSLQLLQRNQNRQIEKLANILRNT